MLFSDNLFATDVFYYFTLANARWFYFVNVDVLVVKVLYTISLTLSQPMTSFIILLRLTPEDFTSINVDVLAVKYENF